LTGGLSAVTTAMSPSRRRSTVVLILPISTSQLADRWRVDPSARSMKA
jgi:hypothetical protein